MRFSLNLIILLLFFAVIFNGTAESAAISDNRETALKPETSNVQHALKYHLVTLPSPNKKRVDALCIKFLYLIPKAMLIPKTEESTVYRLIADTFSRSDSAKKRKSALLRYCESPFIVKSEHGYSLVAGSQLTETLALAEQKRLASKHIATTIHKLRVPLKQWHMKSAESFDIRDAVIMASKLAKVGVITTIEQTAYSMPVTAASDDEGT